MSSQSERRPFSAPNIAHTVAVIILFFGECGLADAKESGRDVWLEKSRETPAGTKYETFHSDAIDEEASFLLYLPPKYEEQKDRRFPVVYWLYGLGSDQRGGAGFVRRLDEAIREGKAPAMIAVLVNGPPASFFCDSPHDKTPAASLIVKDLIPHVDKTYRTIAERRGRAIEGFSMGGFGAAHIGFKYPETFGAVSILAGSLHKSEEFAEKHPGPLATSSGATRITSRPTAHGPS